MKKTHKLIGDKMKGQRCNYIIATNKQGKLRWIEDNLKWIY